MKLRYRLMIWLPSIILLWAGALAGVAQDNACPALVEKALQAVQQICANMGRNEVCYGNNKIEASFTADTSATFAQPADRAPVDHLQTLRTFALDEKTGLWGVALMNIQANLPDTLPGQGVKFILYGDVSLENAATTGDAFGPMQAFYLTTKPGKTACHEAPPSKLVIQSPKGYEVSLNANGMDITVGSTVAFSAEPGAKMKIATLEGKATTKFGDKTRIIPEGFEASVPLGGENGLTAQDGADDLEILDPEEWGPVADSAGVAWDEPVEMVDTSEWKSIDDYCSDPDHAELCADTEFSGAFPDCTGQDCVEATPDLTDCGADCVSEAAPVCGDAVCGVGEDDSSCPSDCAAAVSPGDDTRSQPPTDDSAGHGSDDGGGGDSGG